jgi:hypothetical protein
MIECLSKIKLEIKADPIYFLQCLEKYEVIRFQSNGWYGIFGAVNMYYLEHEQPCSGAHIPKISGGVPNFLGPTFMANQYPNNNHIKIFI